MSMATHARTCAGRQAIPIKHRSFMGPHLHHGPAEREDAQLRQGSPQAPADEKVNGGQDALIGACSMDSDERPLGSRAKSWPTSAARTHPSLTHTNSRSTMDAKFMRACVSFGRARFLFSSKRNMMVDRNVSLHSSDQWRLARGLRQRCPAFRLRWHAADQQSKLSCRGLPANNAPCTGM